MSHMSKADRWFLMGGEANGGYLQDFRWGSENGTDRGGSSAGLTVSGALLDGWLYCA